MRSARYAEGTDKTRYEVVLEKMKDVPEEKRAARFTSVIAVYDPLNDAIVLGRGDCEGRITFEPKGERGFGYDPIFFVESLGKTYAEATIAEKMSIDHRGKAIAQTKAKLLAESA